MIALASLENGESILGGEGLQGYNPPNPNDMATQATPWSDFEVILTELRTMTVNSLKGVITGLVDESCANMGKAGRKSDLQERIVRALRGLQVDGKVDKWIRARAVILQVSSGLDYDHGTLARFMNTSNNRSSGGNTTTPNNSSSYHAPHAPPAPYYASGSRAAIGGTGPPKYSSGLIEPKWRYSPFYRIDQAVSSVQECPESTSSTDRRSSRFNFYLNADHLAKLGSRSPKYQLRLYCTTSQYYITLGTSLRNALCPVEFPPTCEVRVNNRVLTANFRGIKKKAGTAPPADVTDLCNRGVPGVGNALEMIYVNSNQATGNKKPPPQKFYLVVNLVEVTSVDELVERLRRRLQPMEQVIASIKAQQVDDDEVQAGPTKLSLRDPLTYTRINLPCRASSCVHIGCFDAMCWYAMMEQTSTWLCPICDRVLDPDELIIDGFVADILAKVHEDVDDVMIEPDGEWHTEDRTAGSVTWMQKYGVTEATKAIQKPRRVATPPPTKTPSGPSTITIGDSSESEEEEEREVKRELSPPQVTPALQPPRPAAPDVIDLTLSDSDEEISLLPPPPPTRPPPMPASVLGKRKLSSDGELATGSSRRTSTAASHRSLRADEDDYVTGHQSERPHSNTNTNGYYYGSAAGGSFSNNLPSPTASTASSPALYPYPSGPGLPSPTMSSGSVHHHHHSHPPAPWSHPNRPPPFSLPPASSLLSNSGPLPPMSLPPPTHSPVPLPPAPISLPPRPTRPPHQYDHRLPSRDTYRDSRSATSRYAEWGLRQ